MSWFAWQKSKRVYILNSGWTLVVLFYKDKEVSLLVGSPRGKESFVRSSGGTPRWRFWVQNPMSSADLHYIGVCKAEQGPLLTHQRGISFTTQQKSHLHMLELKQRSWWGSTLKAVWDSAMKRFLSDFLSGCDVNNVDLARPCLSLLQAHLAV